MRRCLLLLLLLLPLTAHSANERRYVSCTDGSDANSGLSSSAPKLTIQSAINAQTGAGNIIDVDGGAPGAECVYRGNSTMIASNADGTAGSYNVVRWWNRTGNQVRRPFVTNLQLVTTGFTQVSPNVWCAPWHDSGVGRNSYAMVFRDRLLQNTTAHGQACTLEYDGTCRLGTGFHPNRSQDYWINGTAAPSSISQLNGDGEYFSDVANDRLCVYSTSDPDTRYTQPGVEALINQDNGAGFPLIAIDHSYWRLDGIAYGGCNWHCLIVGSRIASGTIDGWQFLNGEGSFSRHRFTDTGPEGGTLHQLFSNDAPVINITNALVQNSTFHDSGRGTFNNTGSSTVTATYEGIRVYNNFNHGVTSLNHNGNGPRTLTFRNMHVSGICTPFFSADLGNETVPRSSNGIVTMENVAITDPTFDGDPRRPVGANCAVSGNLGAIIDSQRYTLTGTRILVSGFDRAFDQGNTFNITSCIHCTLVNNNQHGIRFGDGVDFTLNTSIVGGNGGNTVSATSAQVICADADCSTATWPGGDTGTTENIYFRDDGSTTGNLFRADNLNLTLSGWVARPWVAGDDTSVVVATNPVPNAASLDFTPPAGHAAIGCGTDTPNVGGTSECGAIEVPQLVTCSVTGNLLRCDVSTLSSVPLATVSGLTPRVDGTARTASQYAVSGTQFTATISGAAITPGQVVTLDAAYGDVQAQTLFSRYITARMHAVTGHPVTNLNVSSDPCTYYASPSGSGNVCTLASPCLVNSAWALLDPGETLCLNNGTYTGANSMIVPPQGKSGTAGAPITVRALNDGQVLIDGQGARNPVRLLETKYLIVEGINAANGGASPASQGYTVVVEGLSGNGNSSNNIIRRVVAWDAGNDNAKLFQGSYTQNNLFEDVAGFGIARKCIEYWSSQNSVMRRVWCRWDGSPTTAQQPRMAVSTYYDSYNITVENTVSTWADLEGQVTDPNGTQRGALSSDNHDGTDPWGLSRGNSVGLRAYGNIAYIDSSYTNARLTGQQACRFGLEDNQEYYDTVCYVQAGIGSSIKALNAPPPESTSTNMRLTNATLIASTSSSINAAWQQGNVENVTNIGSASSIFTGATGATICNRYVNGVLTSDKLWPWPMNARILAATTTYSTVPVDVTATIEGIFGVIPTECTTAPSPGDIFYVDTALGSDSNTCAQAENIATPKATFPSAVACLGPGDTLRLRDDQVHRLTTEVILSQPDVTLERYGNGTRGAVITHFSLVTGSWTATGTANVWERTGYANNIQRMLVVARDDPTGPLGEVTSPVAKSQNYWYGNETQWAHKGACTPASLTSNYNFCWRSSTSSILMYYNGGNPSTITQPGIEVIHMASRPESVLRITGANTTIRGINVLGCAERCMWYRQGSSGSRYYGPAEIGYSRFRDPDVWGSGQDGTVTVEIAPDSGSALNDIEISAGVHIHDCGRDCYHLATFPTTGNGSRTNMVLRDVTISRGYNHAAINACHSGRGTTSAAVFDRLTIWDVCAPALAYDSCLADTDILWSSIYAHSLIAQSDPRVPIQAGDTSECDGNNYYFFPTGQAGVSPADRALVRRSIIVDADIGFRISSTGSFLTLDRSIITGNSEMGVSINGNAGSLQVVDSLVFGNGNGSTATASNGNVVCILGVCDGFLWDIEDSTIDNGANTSVAYLDGASRTISQLNTIDTNAGNQDVAPGLTLPSPRHTITAGSMQVADGNAAAADGPLVGFGLTCTTLDNNTLRITAGTTDTPVIATASRFTILVDSVSRTATSCTATGDAQVDCNISGAVMVGGQDIDLTASLGAVESVCVVGDRTGPCFRQASYPTTALQCSNTLAGSATPVYSMPTWQVYPSHCNASTTAYCRPYGPEKYAPCLPPQSRFTLATAIEVQDGTGPAQQYRLRCRHIPVATGTPSVWELITDVQGVARIATTGNRGVVDDQACASSVLGSSETLCYYVEANGERTLSLAVGDGQRLTVLWSLQIDPTVGNLANGDRIQCEPALSDGTPIAGDPPFQIFISNTPQSVTYR